MTPLDVEILMHFHCCPGQFPRTSGHIEERIEFFVRSGMLKRDTDGKVSGVVPALKVWVDAVCAIRLPVVQWVIPNA